MNKKMRFYGLFKQIASIAILTALFAGFQSCDKEEPVLPGDAAIISFSIGDVACEINESAKTISAELLAGTDVTALIPTILISEGATIDPASGTAADFTNPVVYNVTDLSGTVSNKYTVTITSVELRKMAIIGNAAENTPAAWDACGGEGYDLLDDRTAAEWFETEMASEVNELTYLSFEDVAGGADLSQYHAIWIQYDGGIWGDITGSFPNNGLGLHCILGVNGVSWGVTCDDLVTNFTDAIKTYYEAGGNILLGNYAGQIVDDIGVVSAPEYAMNNYWGGIEVWEPGTPDEWIQHWAGDPQSPLFENIVVISHPDVPAPAFVFVEAGAEKKNRSNQYSLNFGPWAPNGDADPLDDRTAAFESLTGAEILVLDGFKTIVQMLIWEAVDGKGTVIGIIGGTYDWYVGEAVTGQERNMKIFTRNSLNYLVDLALTE